MRAAAVPGPVPRKLLVLLAVALVAGCASPGEVPTPGVPAPTPPAPTPSPAAPTTTPPGTPTAASPTPPAAMEPGPARLRLDAFLDGLSRPLLVTHAGDDSGRLFVVEQTGRILLVRGGKVADEPFLDIRERTVATGERGLLGLAFPPRHEEDGVAYVSYTDTSGDSILARYRLANGTRDRLDRDSEEVILKVDQPYANHNGGHVAFGPDGMLYYGLGDGGSAGDPQGNGQNPNALLGSLLRLDVDVATGYAAPEDNPYKHGNGRAEVWAKGLRNPWRFSFDRATGDLYIGDVGQNKREEIDFQPANAPGGANYGWNIFEGTERFKLIGEPFSETTAPVAEYPTREEGACAVTGGYVYRGAAIPPLVGTYLYADYCSGKMWGLRFADGAWRSEPLLETGLQVSSFGEDEEGELFVVDHGGRVLRVVADG